jgi:hypothetical protein
VVWYNPATWRADPKWPFLSGLPSVQFRLLVLCALDLLTFAATYHTIDTILHNATAAQRADPIVLELWAIWYGLLGGMHGLGYASYKTKRTTSWDGNLEEDRGGGGANRPPIDPATGEAAVPVLVPVPVVQMSPIPAPLTPRPDLGVPDTGVL